MQTLLENLLSYSNLLLCGSMDMCSFILDLSMPEDPLVQKFQDHHKYVVS